MLKNPVNINTSRGSKIHSKNAGSRGYPHAKGYGQNDKNAGKSEPVSPYYLWSK
jgi:hypothetical protein